MGDNLYRVDIDDIVALIQHVTGRINHVNESYGPSLRLDAALKHLDDALTLFRHWIWQEL